MVRLGLIEVLSILLFWSLQTSQNTFGFRLVFSYICFEFNVGCKQRKRLNDHRLQIIT